MAKTKRNQPALRGPEVFSILEVKRIKTEIITENPKIMIVLEGTSLSRNWLGKSRSGAIQRKRARYYVRKGIALISAHIPVRLWELEHLNKTGSDLSTLGIYQYDSGYQRRVFMQIEDIDHAKRQCDHILKDCRKKEIELNDQKTSNFTRAQLDDLNRKKNRTAEIIRTITQRLEKIILFKTTFETSLADKHKKLEKILVEHHKCHFRYEDEDISTICDLIDYCRSIKFRPMSRQLSWARQSLEKSIQLLKDGKLDLFEHKLRLALKHFKYPKTP